MAYCVVFVTASKGPEAKRLAMLVLKRKLCACVNIIKNIESFFWWQGKIDTAKESLLVIKTRKSFLPRLFKAIRLAHSYEVCEIVALPVVAGSKPYLDWISRSLGKEKVK